MARRSPPSAESMQRLQHSVCLPAAPAEMRTMAGALQHVGPLTTRDITLLQIRHAYASEHEYMHTPFAAPPNETKPCKNCGKVYLVRATTFDHLMSSRCGDTAMAANNAKGEDLKLSGTNKQELWKWAMRDSCKIADKYGIDMRSAPSVDELAFMRKKKEKERERVKAEKQNSPVAYKKAIGFNTARGKLRHEYGGPIGFGASSARVTTPPPIRPTDPYSPPRSPPRSSPVAVEHLYLGPPVPWAALDAPPRAGLFTAPKPLPPPPMGVAPPRAGMPPTEAAAAETAALCIQLAACRKHTERLREVTSLAPAPAAKERTDASMGQHQPAVTPMPAAIAALYAQASSHASAAGAVYSALPITPPLRAPNDPSLAFQRDANEAFATLANEEADVSFAKDMAAFAATSRDIPLDGGHALGNRIAALKELDSAERRAQYVAPALRALRDGYAGAAERGEMSVWARHTAVYAVARHGSAGCSHS